MRCQQSMSKPPNDSRDGGFLMAAARYTSIAMALPGATFVGYIAGYGLDKWLGTSYLKIVFLLLGIASGFYELIRQLTRDMEKQK
jgi:F0F1-type ATP synthase assembly protein I